MSDRGILFSAPMVRALLAGTKTQTRRPLRNPEYYGCPTGDCPHDKQAECNAHMGELTDKEKGYAVGDRLYVRESYYQRGAWFPTNELTKGGATKWGFVSDDPDEFSFDAPAEFFTARQKERPREIRWHKRLGRFMPRRYSRLTLTVTDVRVERLQDISQHDAYAEGCERVYVPDNVPLPAGCDANNTYKVGYALLWNSINGPGSWLANPWVVAISFIVRKGNIDDQH